MKLKATGKFYLAMPRDRLQWPLVATNPSFRGAYAGRHPSLPLKGQIAISTDLQEANAEECAGQQFPAEQCERALPVRKMLFDPSSAWEIVVKSPPLTNTRCLDHLYLSSGADPPAFYIAGAYDLRAKMRRGRNFKVSRNVTQQYGKGTLRLTWAFTLTRIR